MRTAIPTFARKIILWSGILLIGLVSFPNLVPATTTVTPTALIEADPDTVAALLATFERAEAAIGRRDLSEVMALYSEKYNYHGLKKSDIEKIWASLFKDYRQIADTHSFTVIRLTSTAQGLVAEITCTGGLWAVSEPSHLRIPIDSWYEEVHQLIRENGVWRIVGNVGEVPKVLPFGTAPHPLF